MSATEFARQFYLDYVNNYLTVAKIAEHHVISFELAEALIKNGKAIHEAKIEIANETLIALRKQHDTSRN
jgi:hypothetical protein